MTILPRAAGFLIGIAIFLGLSAFVIALSALFNRNIGRGTMIRQGPPNPEIGTMMRLVNAFIGLIWWIVSWRTLPHPATDERTRLFSKATATMPEKDFWRENYEAAYKLLGILNEKAEALMVYSGVTLAVLSVANINERTRHETMLHGLIDKGCYSIVVAMFILGSIFCSLIVVGIYWPFLHYGIPDPGRAEHDTEWRLILKVLVVRQNCYRIAWLLSVLALLLLVPFVLVFGL